MLQILFIEQEGRFVVLQVLYKSCKGKGANSGPPGDDITSLTSLSARLVSSQTAQWKLVKALLISICPIASVYSNPSKRRPGIGQESFDYLSSTLGA